MAPPFPQKSVFSAELHLGRAKDHGMNGHAANGKSHALADGDIARSRQAREIDIALEERKVAIAEERVRAETVDLTEVSCED